MIRSFLSRSPLYVLALYASVLIFLVYTCAYAYRKPFTAAIYEGEILWGFDVKILYVLSEIIGYALSKFIGVRILPSMKAGHRIYYIIGLLTFSDTCKLSITNCPKVFTKPEETIKATLSPTFNISLIRRPSI